MSCQWPAPLSLLQSWPHFESRKDFQGFQGFTTNSMIMHLLGFNRSSLRHHSSTSLLIIHSAHAIVLLRIAKRASLQQTNKQTSKKQTNAIGRKQMQRTNTSNKQTSTINNMNNKQTRPSKMEVYHQYIIRNIIVHIWPHRKN